MKSACPNCHAQTGSPNWIAKAHIMWSNQYGECVRVFCYRCGQWTDITMLYSKDVEDIRIVQSPKITTRR